MSLRRNILTTLLLLLPLLAMAQNPVEPCIRWLASVEEDSQQIRLSWNPSEDSSIMGYHICTGSPCLDYDTVFGRLDTIYFCSDHLSTEPHLYRLHVFDSARNVSALTPPFGNIVLQADVPQCSTTVIASWTPYSGMPGGLKGYKLMGLLTPFDTGFVVYHTTDSAGPLSYNFEIPESVTHASLKVLAFGYGTNPLVSVSNIVSVDRLTSDSADYVEISTVEYDSIRSCILLSFDIDPNFNADHYRLYRSVDGSPWTLVDTLPPLETTYSDTRFNPYDSLHCYQIAVDDACGMNTKYSNTRCVVVPDPPPPSVYFPNAILAGDPLNGTFRPVIRGLQGTLYELYIYNRMGLLVFHTDDPTLGWTPLASSPQGVYTYRLRCRFNDNFIKSYVGTVLLIK